MRHAVTAVLVTALLAPAAAQARGGGLSTYHAPPCSGDACKADDPRSGSDCAGLLCTFSSAKAMQKPVTAAEADEAAKTQAAAAQASPAPVPPPVVAATPAAKHKHVAKAKAKPANDASVARATPSPAAASAAK